VFLSAALKADAASVRALLAGTPWFKRWKKAYCYASAELASWMTDPLPKSVADRISIVDRLIDLKAKRSRFENLSERAQALMGNLWRHDTTDFPRLRSVTTWLRRVREEGFAFDLTPAFVLLGRPDLLKEYLVRLREAENSTRTSLEHIISPLDLDVATAFGPSSLNDVALEAVAMRIDAWAEQVGRYSEWSRLADADSTLRNYGHSMLADQIADGALTPERAIEELRHARAELCGSSRASVIPHFLSYATKTG
jgi:hypothetical protein